MDRKRTLLTMAGALTLVAMARPLTAEVSVLTHDAGDLTPHRVQTALNLGVIAFDVLVTWSDHRLR